MTAAQPMRAEIKTARSELYVDLTKRLGSGLLDPVVLGMHVGACTASFQDYLTPEQARELAAALVAAADEAERSTQHTNTNKEAA